MTFKASVRKRERNGKAFFTITWSPLEPVSRYTIIGSVPSMPGIWEVYWLEQSRKPRILKLGRAWTGGLRHSLREQTDASLPMGAAIRTYLETGDCYYRYTICESHPDLQDVYSVLLSHRAVDQPPTRQTGRYAEVRIKEPDEMQINRRRRPHEEAPPTELWNSEVPNMFTVLRELRRFEEEQQRGER